MNKFKKILYIFLLIQLLFSYSPAYAQTSGYNYASSGVDKQIRDYLCTPETVPESQTSILNGLGSGPTTFQAGAAQNNNNSGILFKCINQIYKFAIVLASVIGVFFIVIAGYLYMSSGGDSESVSKAKDILVTTISGIVILLVGYILLKALNPDLIEFHSIQPPTVVLNDGGVNLGLNSGTINTGVCSLNNGGCTTSQISKCSAWASNPDIASAVCSKESRGIASISSGTDLCTDGKSWSIGLFQINIIAHSGKSYMPAACNKPGIFKIKGTGTPQGGCAVPLVTNASGVKYCPQSNCEVADVPAYDECVKALQQPAANITAACEIFKTQGWKAWDNSYKICTGTSSTGSPSISSSLGSSCVGKSGNGGIMLLGDSFMNGMQATFSSKGSLNVNTYCKVGDTITANINAVTKLLPSIQGGPPNSVFISLGTNNFSDSASTLKNLQTQLINSLKGAGAKRIIWIGPPKFTQPQLNYSISTAQNLTLANALKEGAATNGICYYDTYNTLNLYSSTPKDIHDLNYGNWANNAWAWAQSSCP
jgi:hypothetical protein